MSNAERQRKFRANRDADPFQRHKYLESERARSKKRNKNVKDMSQRDQRLVRRRWRQRQRRKRDKDKEPSLLTPPGSPDSQPAPSRQKTSSTKKKISIVKKCKYDNKQLRNKLNQVKRKCNMYRKRLERAKAKDKPHASNKADTPKTKHGSFWGIPQQKQCGKH